MAGTRREFFKTTAAAGAMFGVAGASGLDASQSGRAIPLPIQRAKALMELFGLKYPIFEAPHGPATSPELAVAVSNAGAMGALASLGSPEEARNAVSKVRSATKGYFIVNYILHREPTSLQAALDAGAPIVLEEAAANARGRCRWDRQWARDLQGAVGRCLSGGARYAFCCNRRE